jgi:Leucine-rich repeat (LRR) protein
MPDPDTTAVELQAHEEALKRIGDCARRRGTVLSLSGLGLSSLPPKLVQLTKLTELDLAHNRLTCLPPELAQLTQLTRLDLAHNRLTTLPRELGQLAHLTLLYLSNNQFVALPPELGQLARLTRLDLSHNPLASLPPELGQLVSLTRLDLSNDRLGTLPPELGQLASLTRLYLPNNLLSTLPPELGQLTSLTRLYLSNNRLTSLPPELGQLAKLTVLDASNNQLAALPPELGRLVSLTELDLDNNLLGSLPPELGELAKMTVLRLMGNRLTTLPESLADLAGLERLFLHDNPGLQLSPAVLGSDPRIDHAPRIASAKSILDFYFARQSGQTRPLNEVKLHLLGRSGAGKTSIVQALRDLPFRDWVESTAGIALSEWTMDGGGGGAAVTAHVWDFSGQPITHVLHPFFFTARSLYVVVLTGGRDHNEREDADFWLRLIQTSGTDAQGDGPPVIVALNKWNVPGCRPEVDRVALRERYPFIRGFVEMDCKAKKGVPALKAALVRELERMPWVREPIPAAWDAVRRALATAGMQREHISHSEYRALGVEQDVTDEGQQDYLAEILHHLGVALIYRNTPSPGEPAVLQPEWLTKSLYPLLLRAEKQAGLLKQADVELALPAEKAESSRAYLMEILGGLGIACPLQTAAGGAWLVPQALPATPPAGLADFRDAAEAIRLRYTYQVLPDTLVARIIARRHDFIEELREQKLLWRGGVVLARKGARVLILAAPQDRQMTLTIIGPRKARQQLAELCETEMCDLHAEIPDLTPLAETLLRGAWVATPTREADEMRDKGD